MSAVQEHVPEGSASCRGNHCPKGNQCRKHLAQNQDSVSFVACLIATRSTCFELGKKIHLFQVRSMGLRKY